MIDTFVRYIETKTGIYLYPRFVLSVGSLLASLLLFGIVYFFVSAYLESIQTVPPVGEKAQADYDARMRSSARGLELP